MTTKAPARRQTKKPTKVDPVTAEVIRGALETIAFEMATHVSRTATTPILNQSNERNATIMDARGRLAALAVGIPQFMLSSMGPIRFALEFFDGDFKPGDVIACNDPYHGGGHLPDWSIFSPVFDARGELVLFASMQAHHADTAGMMPGGYPADAMDIWAEGFRCPAVKLVDAGEWRKDVIYLFHTNNRVPTYEGDLKSQIGAAQMGARACAALVDKYGTATVNAALDFLIGLSERRFREEISSWPDGTYEADSFFDHDVKGNKDVKVHAAVTVQGDSLHIDFAGSDARPELQAWSTKGNTRSMAMSQLCSMIDASIPKNEGLFEPVTISYPEGTVVNPPEGKPVSMGTHHPGCEISEAVALALSKAIPQKSIPQVYKAAMPTVVFGLKENGEFFVDHSVDTTSTAAAAGYGQDGWGCTNAGFGNLIMATAEVNEAIFPNRHLGNELITDTGGAGQWRGQCGSFYVKEAVLPQAIYTFVMGMKYPSQGIAGGANGAPNDLWIKVGGDGAYKVEHTCLYVPLDPGERIEYRFGGGGGWGDPLERDPEAVRDDVLDEYVSREAAEQVYGVVLSGKLQDYSLEVDTAATERARAALRKSRKEANGGTAK